MPKIKDLPKNERPREKAIRYGIKSLSNEELLAILIGSGVKGQSAIELSRIILQKCYSLTDLFSHAIQDLQTIKGISIKKSVTIAAAFELAKRYQVSSLTNSNAVIDSEYIYHLVAPNFIGLEKEKFALIILNRKRQIIKEEFSELGAEDFIRIGVRDVLCTCLRNNGKYFYLIHNHPNDTMEASIEDIRITKLLRTECPKLGVHLLDHLIITSNGYLSLVKKRSK